MTDHAHATSRRSSLRTTIMLVGGMLTAAVVAVAGAWPYAFSAGWAVASAIYLVWTWSAIGRLDGPATREQASSQDPDKGTSHLLLVLAALASLVALAVLLSQSKSGAGMDKWLLALLGAVSVALSWFFVHTLYAVRYAVLYYDEASADRRPISFNEEIVPRYVDFAYLSFTVGMTFQVSDTNVSSQRIRAMILRHMLLSYLFGAVILAGAVNLLAGLAA